MIHSRASLSKCRRAGSRDSDERYLTGKEVIFLLDELALSNDRNYIYQLLDIFLIIIFLRVAKRKSTDKVSLWGNPDCSDSQVPNFGA